jgi:hypothetical protein
VEGSFGGRSHPVDRERPQIYPAPPCAGRLSPDHRNKNTAHRPHVKQTPSDHAVTTGHARAWRGAEHSGSTTGASYLMLIEGLQIVQASRYSPQETCPAFLHVQIVRAFHPGSVSVWQAHWAVGRVLERLEGPPRLFRCCSQVQAQKGAENVDGVCHVSRVLRCIVHYPEILQLRVQHRLHQRLADVVQRACADTQRGTHTTRDRARRLA